MPKTPMLQYFQQKGLEIALYSRYMSKFTWSIFSPSVKKVIWGRKKLVPDCNTLADSKVY